MATTSSPNDPHRRPSPVRLVSSTEPPPFPDGAIPCAACRARTGVRTDARLPGVAFCEDCWDLARPPGDDEELELGTAD